LFFLKLRVGPETELGANSACLRLRVGQEARPVCLLGGRAGWDCVEPGRR